MLNYYRIRMSVPGVNAVSDLIIIMNQPGYISFEVLEDEVSLADRPTGYIIGEVLIPSGGNPYEAAFN
jgi:hypothetical protein